jgi:hypothetical protein
MERTIYGELFDEYIKDRLREGGDPDYMVSMVRIYSEEDSSLRGYAFQEWIRDSDFSCSRCGTRFRKKDEDIGWYTEVLCPRCRPGCRDS